MVELAGVVRSIIEVGRMVDFDRGDLGLTVNDPVNLIIDNLAMSKCDRRVAL